MVRWVSGRNQQFAKLSHVLKRVAGSNPALTAVFSFYTAGSSAAR